MQDVNDDMDDLFRKAAAHYPLQTGGADWDKVLAGLQDDNNTPVPVVTDSKQKRNKQALWLLLLLPLCLLYVPLHNHSFTGLPAKKGDEEAKISSGKNIKDAIADNTIQTTKQAAGKAINNDTNSSQNNVDNSIVNAHSSAQSFDANGNKRLGNTSAVLVKNKTIKLSVATNKELNKNRQILAASSGKKSKLKEEKEFVFNKNNNSDKQPNETSSRIQKTTTEDDNNTVGLQKDTSINDTTAINKTDSAFAKNSNETDKNKKIKKPQTQWQKGFYGGMAGSFDVSTVKLQRINKTGYGLQIIAGYRFSKHLSVETGLGWNVKNYYSNGKYFDKKKANIPNVVEIYYSDGNCKMLEIPVSLKYDFAIHNKSSFFITGGLSSYIMKKENYFYKGNYNMMWVYDTTRCYKNSGSNLLSVAGFSIGYQLQLNKHSTLRIEPYIKLPLHGIGIANMPITSTGISVGFTRKF